LSSVFDKKFEQIFHLSEHFLPEKREFIKNNVLPLKKEYDLKLYGQDWPFPEKVMSFSKKLANTLIMPSIKRYPKNLLYLSKMRQRYINHR
jgi:hypothetical protein